MLTIHVPRDVSRVQFEVLAERWAAANDAVLEVDMPDSENEWHELSSLLFDLIHLDLACSTLAEICEAPGVPEDILEEAFRKGGAACRVSICLRDDLSESLSAMCARCDDEVVTEHFQQKRR